MINLGYYNGRYGALEEMSVPMTDRVCFFGDGVYDATYSRNYNIFALDEHIDRFFKSAALLDIKLDFGKESLAKLLKDLARKCDSGNLFICWQATRGSAVRNHSYPEDMTANLWVVIKPCDIVDMNSKISLITVADTRFFHCNIKTLNLIPSVMAAQKAQRAGAHEAVFHRGDRVTECAHSNIHILKDGRLITPPADEYILAGVARAHLISMCEAINIGVEIRPFTLSEMTAADEIIVTSSGSLCLRVGSIDGRAVGGRDGATVEMLQNALLDEFIAGTDGSV